jgi:hypothetical protein
MAENLTRAMGGQKPHRSNEEWGHLAPYPGFKKFIDNPV